MGRCEEVGGKAEQECGEFVGLSVIKLSGLSNLAANAVHCIEVNESEGHA